MTVGLLLAAVIIIVCIASSRLSGKLGVPALLIFIVLGMLFGSDGVFKIPFDNYNFAEQICSVALIFIMFYGGFGTNWKMAKPVIGKAVALSTLGVVITALLTGLFCYYVVGFSFLESMLVGAVISSTDAASVFSVLRSKKLNLKNNTASLLEVESGSNDPAAYMLTIIVLTLMEGKGVDTILYMVFAQVIFGTLFGVGIALLSVFVLCRSWFSSDGLDAMFVLAIAVLSYALPSLIGGNGYLSAYIAGIILGNSKIKNKVPLVHFFDGVTGLSQIVIFFFAGSACISFTNPANFIALHTYCAFPYLYSKAGGCFCHPNTGSGAAAPTAACVLVGTARRCGYCFCNYGDSQRGLYQNRRFSYCVLRGAAVRCFSGNAAAFCCKKAFYG